MPEGRNTCWNCSWLRFASARWHLACWRWRRQRFQYTQFSGTELPASFLFSKFLSLLGEILLVGVLGCTASVLYDFFFNFFQVLWLVICYIPPRHLISLYKCQPEWMVSLYVVSGSLTNDTIIKWGEETTLRITVLRGNCLVPSDLWSLPTVKSSLIEPNSPWTQGWSWGLRRSSCKLCSIS